VHHSKGEWIAFLDSDDWWLPTKLQTVAEEMKISADVIYHDLQIFNSSDALESYAQTKSRKLKSPLYLDLLLNGNDIALSSVVLRKSIFLKVNGMNESPGFFAVEDFDTWLRIAQITELFVHIPKPLGAYRLHDGNIGKINNFQYLSNALKAHLKNLNERQLRRYQSLYIYQIARSKYNDKQYRESTGDLLFVFKFGRAPYVIKSAVMILNNLVLRGIIPKKSAPITLTCPLD
jgi:glycosyltransferase involved in cell wall biosynthesis